jgi:flagellin-like protein
MLKVRKKRAEMGVGTLIIFIAMLLVAAVAAGVLIQTAGSLQEKSLATGQQSRSQISTNARVIEVSATDGRFGNLTDFQEIVKLSPGSEPIKLDQIIFTFNTKDSTSTLKYKGTDGICMRDNSVGYNTWNEERLPQIQDYRGRDTGSGSGAAYMINHLLRRTTYVDLDGDHAAEFVNVCPGGTLCASPYNDTDNAILINMSTDGPVYVLLENDDGSIVNLSETDATSGMNITSLAIGEYGYISAYRDNADSTYTISDLDPGTPSSYFRIFTNRFTLDEDYDDDGLDDYLAVNDTEVALFLSHGETLTVALGANVSLGAYNISVAGTFSNSTYDYAAIAILANMTESRWLPEGSIVITPEREGEGYFVAVYEQEGTNHVAGNLQRGDIIRICLEAPGEIVEDEEVRLNFIPKIGTATLTQFVTPDVISTERTYLYP